MTFVDFYLHHAEAISSLNTASPRFFKSTPYLCYTSKRGWEIKRLNTLEKIARCLLAHFGFLKETTLKEVNRQLANEHLRPLSSRKDISQLVAQILKPAPPTNTKVKKSEKAQLQSHQDPPEKTAKKKPAETPIVPLADPQKISASQQDKEAATQEVALAIQRSLEELEGCAGVPAQQKKFLKRSVENLKINFAEQELSIIALKEELKDRKNRLRMIVEAVPLTFRQNDFSLEVSPFPVSGIPNYHGSNCWINAALQYIAHSRMFDYYLAVPILPLDNPWNPQGAIEMANTRSDRQKLYREIILNLRQGLPPTKEQLVSLHQALGTNPGEQGDTHVVTEDVKTLLDDYLSGIHVSREFRLVEQDYDNPKPLPFPALIREKTGHYVTLVRTQEGWIELNDSRVQKVGAQGSDAEAKQFVVNEVRQKIAAGFSYQTPSAIRVNQ